MTKYRVKFMKDGGRERTREFKTQRGRDAWVQQNNGKGGIKVTLIGTPALRAAVAAVNPTDPALSLSVSEAEAAAVLVALKKAGDRPLFERLAVQLVDQTIANVR